jgi:hypothetical protein
LHYKEKSVDADHICGGEEAPKEPIDEAERKNQIWPPIRAQMNLQYVILNSEF